MNRTKGLNPFSPKKLAALAAAGITHPSNTFASPDKPEPRKPKPQRYTGPKMSVTKLVDRRSGKWCEWPGCGQPATERHHRLNRKSGGRHGEAHDRINGAAWLLDACWLHHAYVTSPSGQRRKVAERMGWLLREHQDATQVPVETRHHVEPVWLDDLGNWHAYEAGAA